MHILLIHQAFASIDEAGGTRHHELARYFVQRGHHTTIIASRVSYLTGHAEEVKETNEPGVSILRAYTYRALHASFIHRIFSFLSFMLSSFLKGLGVRKIDLVWGTTPPIFQSVTALLIARLKRVPFLLEVRDLWPEFAIAVGVLKNPLIISLSRRLETFLYSHADLVIVNSPGYLEYVKTHGAKRVELVPNGADLSMFEKKAKSHVDYRKAWRLEGKFLVIYAGAHGMSNNLSYVLIAASRLTDHPNIHFVFLGDGKEKNNLRCQAKEYHLNNVSFFDPIPKSEMGNALMAADACLAVLLPIDWYKTTYPNKVFDYMAAEKPVLLCIDGVIREVVESANCGIFCDPHDPVSLAKSILRLAHDTKICHQMGKRGRAYLKKHFDREFLAERFAILIEELKKKDG